MAILLLPLSRRLDAALLPVLSTVGEPDAGVRLAPPAPDPLLDRARALVRQVSNRAWLIHRGTTYGLLLGSVLPLFWFSGRFQDRLPGGPYTLNVFLALLLALGFGWIIFRRVPRR